MKIALYLDEDSQDSVLIRALRSRGVDVIAASEAGMNGRSDDEQLQWSTTHARVLYSCNARDFYKLHTSLLTLERLTAGSSLHRNSNTQSASSCADCSS